MVLYTDISSFQAEKARQEREKIEKDKKAAQEEEKRLEEAERKKAALAALNVKQGPKTGMFQTFQKNTRLSLDCITAKCTQM